MCKFSWAYLGKNESRTKATDSNPKWAGPCQTCVKWKGLGKVWTSWNHTVAIPAFDSFFCQDLNKVAMGIYRPCSGIFVRQSPWAVSPARGPSEDQLIWPGQSEVQRPPVPAALHCWAFRQSEASSYICSLMLHCCICLHCFALLPLFCDCSVFLEILGANMKSIWAPKTCSLYLPFWDSRFFETPQDSLEYVCLSAASLRVKMFRSRWDQR